MSSDRKTLIYLSPSGRVNLHHLFDVTESDSHIQGRVAEDLPLWTFSKDRILEIVANPEDGRARREHFAAIYTPDHVARIPKKPPIPRPQGLTIVFSGFGADERSTLESRAAAAGLLVRKSVSTILSFLVVVDERKSWRKVQEARANGRTILLDCAAFEEFMMTGEIPDNHGDSAEA